MLEIVKSKSELQKRSEFVDVSIDIPKNDILELKSTLEFSSNGVGLAAPQIGIFKRIIAIKPKKEITIMINPKITDFKDYFISRNEGCLSFPEKRVDTVRHREIEVAWQDESGDLQIERFENFEAVILQHEIDHLDGILMFDRSPPRKYDLCFCGSQKKYKFCCYDRKS